MPKERLKRPYVRIPVGSLQEMDGIVQGDGYVRMGKWVGGLRMGLSGLTFV